MTRESGIILIREAYRSGVGNGAKLDVASASLSEDITLAVLEKDDEDRSHLDEESLRKISSSIGRVAIRADIEVDVAMLSGEMCLDTRQQGEVWAALYPRDRYDAKRVHNLFMKFDGAVDLRDMILELSSEPYITPTEIKHEIAAVLDPKKKLKEKCALFKELLEELSGDDYVNDTRVRHAVRNARNPRAKLETGIKQYQELLAEFHGHPYITPYLIKHQVRQSADPREQIVAKARQCSELAEEFSDDPFVRLVDIRREVFNTKDPRATLKRKSVLYQELLVEFQDSHYAGRQEIRSEVRIAANPRARLRAKEQLYEDLLEEFRDSPFATPAAIKHALRNTKDARLALRRQEQKYRKLISEFASSSYASEREVAYEVLSSKDPQASLTMKGMLFYRLQQSEYAALLSDACKRKLVRESPSDYAIIEATINEAIQFAEKHSVSPTHAVYLLRNKDPIAQLLYWLQFTNIKTPIYLDAEVRDSSRSNHQIIGHYTSGQEEVQEMSDLLGEIIREANISEDELEILMESIVDNEVDSDSLSADARDVLERLRKAAANME